MAKTIGILAEPIEATANRISLDCEATETVSIGNHLFIGKEVVEVAAVESQSEFFVTRGACDSIIAQWHVARTAVRRA